MFLAVIVIIVIGLAGYFHYLQGLFSSALSAIFAVIAALIAMSYHEDLVRLLNPGKFASYAHAVCLISIFSVTYIVLRLIFDGLVPGNVRFPVLMDRIGSAALGVVAGLMAAGIVVIAAQMLPFSPSVAGYARYEYETDQEAQIKQASRSQQIDTKFDKIKDPEKFRKNDATGLLIPVDDMLLGLFTKLTMEESSLSRGKPFNDIHPDYLQELYGQRTGFQPGSKRMALPAHVQVTGLYIASTFPQADQETFEQDNAKVGVRGKSPLNKVDPIRRAGPNNTFLIIRAHFDPSATDDKSDVFAFSPASVRLVANRQNYFPIGTLEAAKTLYKNEPDDYLFAGKDKCADIVFEVPIADVFQGDLNDKLNPPTIKQGVFVEIKRLARIQLDAAGTVKKTVDDPGKGEEAIVEVIRKAGTPASGVSISNTGANVASSAKGATLDFDGGPVASSKLFTAINVGTPQASGDGIQGWGSFSLRDRKFSLLSADPTESLTRMAQGPNTVADLAVPPGQVMIQFVGRPASAVADKWAWGDKLSDYTLTDAAGKHYAPQGAIAKVANTKSNQDMLAARYDMSKPVGSVLADKDSRPLDVTLLFLVPAKTEIKSIDYKGEVLKPVQFKAP